MGMWSLLSDFVVQLDGERGVRQVKLMYMDYNTNECVLWLDVHYFLLYIAPFI